jgi:hypothetical protein
MVTSVACCSDERMIREHVILDHERLKGRYTVRTAMPVRIDDNQPTTA